MTLLFFGVRKVCTAYLYTRCGVRKLLFLGFFLLFLFPLEQLLEVGEVFLHNDAEPLCVQRVAREVAVVGTVVEVQCHIAVRHEQILDVEIADECRCVGGNVVAITELAVDEQAVVEQASRKYAFVLGIAETVVTCGYVCAKVPVVVVYNVR